MSEFESCWFIHSFYPGSSLAVDYNQVVSSRPQPNSNTSKIVDKTSTILLLCILLMLMVKDLQKPETSVPIFIGLDRLFILQLLLEGKHSVIVALLMHITR